jgi:hypothetical protein
VSVAVGAAAFGIAVEREWGSSARSAAWVFAVVLAGSLLLAAFPYTLGLAFALLSIVALQAGRFRVFGALVVATFTASPLAFLMLVVLLSAAFVRSRRFLWQAGLPVLATAGLGALLWRLFPGAGRFPFSLTDLAAVLLFCVLGLALTEGVEHAGLLFALFGIYALTSVLCYVVPSEIGANVGRLRYVAVPVAILTLSLRRWKPLIPALAAFALALSWNVTPLIASVERSSEDPSASKAYWLPVIRFLHEHLSPNYRVEAVATAGHWEATYLPSAGIPIVRGWFRQDDFPSDALLYTPRLAPRAYVGWLDRMGARYVVLTDAPPDYSSRAEEILLRSGATHLPVVYRTAEITIFEVPSSTPILTGPARPRIVVLNNNGLVLDLHGPGRYRLAVSYTPYWSAPGACIERGTDGMVTLTARHAGLVRVGFGFDVPRALAAIEGTTTDCSSKGAPS